MIKNGVVFCFDSKIVQQTIIATASCALATKSRLHFFFVTTSEASKSAHLHISALDRWLNQTTGQKLFYSIHIAPPDLLATLPSVPHLPQAACLRLVLHLLLPKLIHKVIYLDSDVFVTGDLSPLFNFELNSRPIAAVEDQLVCRGGPGEFVLNRMGHGCSKYFNTGVLIMDLALLDQGDYGRVALDLISKNPAAYPYLDQDALNVVLKDNWAELPKLWNFFVCNHKRSSNWGLLNPWRYAISLPKGILHFPGGQKPWCDFCYSAYRFHYMKLAKDIFPDFVRLPCRSFKQQILIWIPAFCYDQLRVLYRMLTRLLPGA